MTTFRVRIFCGGASEPFTFDLDSDAVHNFLCNAQNRKFFRVRDTVFNGDRIDAIKIDAEYWRDPNDVDR